MATTTSFEREYWQVVQSKLKTDPRRVIVVTDQNGQKKKQFAETFPWAYHPCKYSDEHFSFHPDIYKTGECKLKSCVSAGGSRKGRDPNCCFRHPNEKPHEDLSWRNAKKPITYEEYRFICTEYKMQPCKPEYSQQHNIYLCQYHHEASGKGNDRRQPLELNANYTGFKTPPVPSNFIEKAYHPEIYKTAYCNSIINKEDHCPRGRLCCFAHGPLELRFVKKYYIRLLKEFGEKMGVELDLSSLEQPIASPSTMSESSSTNGDVQDRSPISSPKMSAIQKVDRNTTAVDVDYSGIAIFGDDEPDDDDFSPFWSLDPVASDQNTQPSAERASQQSIHSGTFVQINAPNNILQPMAVSSPNHAIRSKSEPAPSALVNIPPGIPVPQAKSTAVATLAIAHTSVHLTSNLPTTSTAGQQQAASPVLGSAVVQCEDEDHDPNELSTATHHCNDCELHFCQSCHLIHSSFFPAHKPTILCLYCARRTGRSEPAVGECVECGHMPYCRRCLTTGLHARSKVHRTHTLIAI
eukprot:Colp12_sorted_trinity150504_noHs@22570